MYHQHRHTFRYRDTLAAAPDAAVASEYDNTLEFIAPITGYSDAAFAKPSEINLFLIRPRQRLHTLISITHFRPAQMHWILADASLIYGIAGRFKVARWPGQTRWCNDGDTNLLNKIHKLAAFTAQARATVGKNDDWKLCAQFNNTSQFWRTKSMLPLRFCSYANAEAGIEMAPNPVINKACFSGIIPDNLTSCQMALSM